MDQRRSLHPFCEGDHVLRPDDVCAQAAFECGVKRYVAGGIDDDVDVVGNRLRFFLAVTEVGFGDVAAANDDLIVDETLERAAVALAQRIERRRGDDVVPESCFGLFLRPRAHREIDLSDVRKAMQQHAERHLTEEARASNQEDLAVVVDLGRREIHIKPRSLVIYHLTFLICHFKPYPFRLGRAATLPK